MPRLFPLISWLRIEKQEADRALVAWEHYLGECERPFGQQSFGLVVDGQLAAVAVSASTVSATVEECSRFQVIELARLCSHPEHSELTRVALRLWRVTAAREWVGEYGDHWPAVAAYVSYSASRHRGDIYRFDGWKRIGPRKGSTGGGSHTKKKSRDDKVLWMYRLAQQPNKE